MIRKFNGRPLELLAPAGNFDIYKDVIQSSCDAVYCGGQVLNMRMIRKGFNFSNEELKEAVDLANENSKKLYITVNSLIDPSEMGQAEEYMAFLQELQPHGLIVQDMAILSLAKKMGVTVPLHSSVMMNVHNIDMIRFLERQGVERVVLSREMSFQDVRLLSEQTDVELEYFTHGDMCVCHGSQCLYSSWIFGMSSNRGRCLKPCRWPFSLPESESGSAGDKPFPLAVKDMNLYSHLGDMIAAGVSSFKIEGRMRNKEFIVELVNRYGEALDRFLADPLGGDRSDPEDMEAFKKRDFSTGFAYGNPGLENINTLGEGTGKFFSTGKMFSTPTKEKDAVIPSSAAETDAAAPVKSSRLKLSVRVNSPEQARAALKGGAGRIYLSLEPLAPAKPASLNEIEELSVLCSGNKAELYLALPRMTDDRQGVLLREYFEKKPAAAGVLAGNSGVFEFIDTEVYSLVCDYTMNIYNGKAAAFFTSQGATEWTPSLELPFASLQALSADAESAGAVSAGEAVVHGLPSVMYMEHDVSNRGEDEVHLDTEVSRLTIRKDWWERYHLLPHKELCLLPRMAELIAAGYGSFRLELQAYGIRETEALVSLYNKALNSPEKAEELFSSLETTAGGFTYGAHQF